MWSEHCSYKSSRVYLKKLPTRGRCVVQGPGENAGVIDIGEGQVLVFKIESHNHPSFIEPFQGAATGVGGILRDIFTMGARPIALLDSLRFGELDKPKNRYLFEHVVAGIAGYGNCMGVPTVGGEVYFDDIYSQNPLVNVFCLGTAKKERIFLGKATGIGNPVIYVGSKTGRDGIHGATMASEEFDEGSEERRPTVQVGDPFGEKLLLEACLELMHHDYIVGIQDMGAAGLTCSTCEMAARGGVGIEIDLTKVPQREAGMTPYEIMLSESQERMLLVAKAGMEDKVAEIFHKWDLDCAVIGKVTNDGLMRVKNGSEQIAEIPAKELADQAPCYQRPVQKPAYLVEKHAAKAPGAPLDYNQALLKLLSSPTIASKEWVYQQYDHMVRINSIQLPGADAAVLRLPDTERKAVAISLDGNARYCYLDPYQGAQLAVAEAARNVVCSGAKPLAVTNNLNFGNPEKPEIMWQFAQVTEGIGDACRAFDTPVTGGNVSLYNETLGTGIYPTPVIGMVGLLEDYTKMLTPWFKQEGDVVVLLGDTKEEWGGSEYLKVLYNRCDGLPPRIDLQAEKRLQQLVLQSVEQGLLNSAHDCSEGGLAVALAECCLLSKGTAWGAQINLAAQFPAWIELFAESASRIIVSVNSSKLSQLEQLAKQHNVPLQILGKVGGGSLIIGNIIDLELTALKSAWKGGLEGRL
ncbi:MAG: phosphoribosylformylglycinamidine synthase subunit PurL, partial [Candidatus Schekmanbacteria bacterium]|nr:phosphoribosylformylglycinamidine synthase subunit PurL [Candidatus Schekmanbacteria bacterium]